MNSRLDVTATVDMAVLLSEPEACRPRVSAPATYRSGTPRVQSRDTAGRLHGLATVIHATPELKESECKVIIAPDSHG